MGVEFVLRVGMATVFLAVLWAGAGKHRARAQVRPAPAFRHALAEARPQRLHATALLPRRLQAQEGDAVPGCGLEPGVQCADIGLAPVATVAARKPRRCAALDLVAVGWRGPARRSVGADVPGLLRRRAGPRPAPRPVCP